MIKWLSGSRLKTGTQNECRSPYTNDPLAAIAEVSTAEGQCHIYAVSRVNPLFREEVDSNIDELLLQGSSPRKSISSGYESRCNSLSDSSSCTECEKKHLKKPLPLVKKEKRFTKQSKIEKKKRGNHGDKWNAGRIHNSVAEENRKNLTNFKRRSANLKNASPTITSILSPIPEGRIDCSIPPPVWPRFEKTCENKRETSPLEFNVPARLYHNGTTNPVNFMFKYNERYPKFFDEENHIFFESSDRRFFTSKTSSVKIKYEQNWEECYEDQYDKLNRFKSDDGDNIDDNGMKGFEANVNASTSDNTSIERLSLSENELAQGILRNLTSLIAYAMSRNNSLLWESFLENLADFIHKSLQTYSQEEIRDNEIFTRGKYLKKLLTNLLNSSNSSSNNSDKISASKQTKSTDNGALKLENFQQKSQISNEGLAIVDSLNNYKDDVYSSESEGQNSTSSSSGCKDLYISSTSSLTASKKNAFSSSSAESVNDVLMGDKVLDKTGKNGGKDDSKEATIEEKDGLPNLIHHQRDFSSSSTESAFGSSDSSPLSSDSYSTKDVLSSVFLQQDIYGGSKITRNAMISVKCDWTKNEDIEGSIRNSGGSSAFEKFISAKRKTSCESQMEDLGPLTHPKKAKTRPSPVLMPPKVAASSVFKKVEHPYYVAIGRPDFTLDLPQAEKLMKKIASSKRRRCWCRFMTSILGLLFFLLSVMMVSLVITKGRRMFGAL